MGRFKFKNIEVYLDLEKKGKSIALLCAHYASYEWAISINSKISFEGYAVYKKINNRYFDKLVRDIRIVELALGDGKKKVYDSEIPIRAKLRRVLS